MWFDFKKLPRRSKYKLLTATVVPRPIAPVALGLEGGPGGARKHTTENVRKRGEVLAMTVRDGITGPETMRLDQDRYDPIGWLYANGYVRLHDRSERSIPEPDDGDQRGSEQW